MPRTSHPSQASFVAGLLTAGIAMSWAGLPALANTKGEPVVRVTIPPLTSGAPFTGTLTLYLMREDAPLPPSFHPTDGPFYDDPQPMFSMQVQSAMPGDVIEFRPTAGFPGAFSEVRNGKYRGQVVLDREQSHTSWLHEMDNLYSPIRWFELSDTDREPYVQFPLLNNAMKPLPTVPGVEVIRVDSPTMSAFSGPDATFDIGVTFPKDYDPEKSYPAVYLIPGFALTNEFGGDHREAYLFGAERIRRPDDHHAIWSDAFIITVSPQAKWGHSLWSDSPANGPVAQAFVNDLIPVLEERYSLIPQPEARLLWGHGSGGWGALWLQLNFPDVFGGVWAASPDPVDFRAFFSTDIYNDANFFTDSRGQARPFYQKDGKVRSTTRDAARMEEVMGPGLTSGKQLASWQAAFGPVNDSGAPSRLFDPHTGAIDRSVAQQWRARDIGDLLRAEPQKYGPIVRDRVRIVAGDADNFYSHKAVELLKADAAKLGYAERATSAQGPDHGALNEHWHPDARRDTSNSPDPNPACRPLAHAE